MALITRTTTIAVGQAITRETIADLLENALLSQIGRSDLDVSAIVVTAQSEAPTARPGMWWWDMTDQLMKSYDSTHSLWLAIGPDRKDAAMQNWSGTVRARGDIVGIRMGEDNERRAILPTTGSAAGDDSDMILGTWAETTASGAWGPVSFVGLVWCRIGSTSDAVTPGDWLAPSFDLDDGTVKDIGQGDPTDNAPFIAAQASAVPGTGPIRAMYVGHRRGS